MRANAMVVFISDVGDFTPGMIEAAAGEKIKTMKDPKIGM